MMKITYVLTVLSQLIFSAHIWRHWGLTGAILTLLLLASLLWRQSWIPQFWSVVLWIQVGMWLQLTLDLAGYRLASGQAWGRLTVIMLAVISLMVGCAWLWGKATRFHFKPDKL